MNNLPHLPVDQPVALAFWARYAIFVDPGKVTRVTAGPSLTTFEAARSIGIHNPNFHTR